MKDRKTSRGFGTHDFVGRQTDRFVLAVRNTFNWAISNCAMILGGIVILVMVLSLRNLCAAMNTSRVTLHLNYAEAAQGLFPNETRFRAYEIKSDAVMAQAIDYLGMTGQVTSEELADCIMIRGSSATSVNGATTFISTSYSITYTDDLHLPGRSANTVLTMICKAYKDVFFSRYTDNQTVLQSTALLPWHEDEYLIRLELLEMKTNQLAKYVSERIGQNKNFTDPVSGMSFVGLQQQLNNLLTYDIPSLSAFILESGVCSDREGLMALLGHKIRMNTLNYDRLMASYRIDNEGITLYDKAMSSIVMIPTTDLNQNYYMSRTRTGMDSLANRADEALSGAATLQSVISYDQYVSEKLSSNRPTVEQTRKAGELLEELQARIDRLAADILTVDDAFIRQNKRAYISFRSNDPSFLAAMSLPSVAVDTVLLMLGLMVLRLAYEWVRTSQKNRETVNEA